MKLLEAIARFFSPPPEPPTLYVPTGRPANTSLHLKRRDEIAQLRRDGKTYREIGEVYGITRERVRQILVKHGDASLLGVDAPFGRQRREASEKRRTVACATCGKEHVVHQVLPYKHYCSRACRWNRPEWRTRAAEIMALRQQGKTWREINKEIFPHMKNGPTASYAFRFLAAWAKATGTDISHVYGKYNLAEGVNHTNQHISNYNRTHSDAAAVLK